MLNAHVYAVLAAYGICAILFGAQWMVGLSSAQSALAGALFIAQSYAPMPAAIVKISGYATVGAVYFLISAIWPVSYTHL